MTNVSHGLDGLEALDGKVLLPEVEGYAEARAVENALVDNRPAVIVRCSSEQDVIDALRMARVNGLEVSVKGGGHHVAGLAVADGGVMIDLGGLDSIDIDVEGRTVRAGAGLTWGALIGATQAHGLATPSGAASTVGIAGLTLGGGLGWLMAKHGLTSDNVLAARVVTAHGEVVVANAAENEDLFWALRGGGGNFGIVTEFTYRLHPVGPEVTAGLIVHPIEDAAEVLRQYRSYTESCLSDDVVVFAMLFHSLDGTGVPLAAFTVVHIGSAADAERELEPLMSFGSPLARQVTRMRYTDFLDQMTFPKGLHNFTKSSFLADLDDDAVEAMITEFTKCPSPMGMIVLEHFHGAATRVPVDATAVALRKVGINLLVFGLWSDPATSDENIAWVRETYKSVSPFFEDILWVNYAGIDDVSDADASQRGYGPNYARLRQIKSKYDPENRFNRNLNIQPAG